jgi:hypothetical protein
MGYWKNLQVFCRQYSETHRRFIDPNKRGTQDAYAAYCRGLSWKLPEVPEIADDRDLTWDEVDSLTGGIAGTHHTPCPYCGPDKELSTRFKIERTLIRAKWHCFYCSVQGTTENDSGEVADADELIAARQLRAEQRADTRSFALRLWDEATSIKTGSTADVYLKAREVELPPNPDAVMRWHPRCPFGKKTGRVGCIVSLFRDAITDVPTGVHRTYLYSATRGKAQRMALGTMSAIKLWPLNGVDTLAVGEGIETVLAAVKLGEARPPAWAMATATNLAKLQVIPGVSRLTVLADNDRSGTGEAAARALRREWMEAGRDVRVRMPRDVEVDFNDLLRRQS